MMHGARMLRDGSGQRAFLIASCLLVAALVAWCATAGAQDVARAPRLLDNFDDVGAWKSAGSDGVRAGITAARDVDGGAMRLDFDLGGTAGYALAHRALALDLPTNYEISFDMRADAPTNDFQFKLIDAGGDNVWWFNRPNFALSGSWEHVRIKKRQIEFAWGPAKDHTLTHAASLEFVVAAGSGGGAGAVYFRHLSIRELPPPPVSWPTPSIAASSSQTDAGASLVFDGKLDTAWKSDPATGPTQMLTLDFGGEREFGGLVLRWLSGAAATRYDVAVSDDGREWQTVRQVTDGGGGPDALYLPEAEARFVRLILRGGPADYYALAELEVKDLEFAASPNAFFAAVARDWPRGYFPRGFVGEQAYWTLVGIDGGSDTGLLSEDGALEVGKAGFSVEPFVVVDGKVVTWADVDIQHDLRERYLPMPGVTWRRPAWSLHVEAFATGPRTQSRLIARYSMTNLTAKPLSLDLVLAVRPFQVNPPTQTLNTVGGATAIRDLEWNGVSVAVNGEPRVFPLRVPDRVAMAAFDAGPVAELIAAPQWTTPTHVRDAFGFASAALRYNMTLPAHGSSVVDLLAPLAGAPAPATLQTASPAAWVDREQLAAAATWREKLNRVSFQLPAAAQPLVDTLRTSLAHILITRDGPILRPGTRSYARSWIRDGAMMADALLRLGHPDVASDYLHWYAPHQFANGKIPCCVDKRGADPVPENDSGGEFMFLAGEVYRYTRDREAAEAVWPRVASAARYGDELRRSEQTEAHRNGDARAFYGLMPASISHEGYSAKPMHSYWDDFWEAKGYDAAIDLAHNLGKDDDAKRLAIQRDEFVHDVAASLRVATATQRIAYLPGSAELGDFDPTSTSIAFAPGSRFPDLPATMVAATYERYWSEFVARRDVPSTLGEYTPYELRTVGTFIRLGWGERAQELLRFFMADRRPAAWNQWAEVVGRDARQPRFVGDMPHGWIASDYIRSLLDVFAFERHADHSIAIAAGVPPAWLAGTGVRIARLRTPYGDLSYSLQATAKRIELSIAGGMRVPPGGFVFAWPGATPPPLARVNGKVTQWQNSELHIAELPARVLIEGHLE